MNTEEIIARAMCGSAGLYESDINWRQYAKETRAVQAALAEHDYKIVPRDVLQTAQEAMATWCAVTAPTECSEENVAAALKRINEGGTLWYIATVNDKITAHLKNTGERVGG
jgi:hypothetical protein